MLVVFKALSTDGFESEANEMNEFEQQLVDKVLEGIHGLELKVTEELGEMRGEITGMTQKTNQSIKRSAMSLSVTSLWIRIG